jgi:hypothetical protein
LSTQGLLSVFCSYFSRYHGLLVSNSDLDFGPPKFFSEQETSEAASKKITDKLMNIFLISDFLR